MKQVCILAALILLFSAARGGEAKPDPAVRKNEAEVRLLLARYLAAQQAHAALTKGFAAGFTAATRSVKLSAEQVKKVKKLISQLGDNDFGTREDASRELKKFGRLVLPFLEAAKKSKDPEVVTRAAAVIKSLTSRSRKPTPRLVGTGKPLPWYKVTAAFASAVTRKTPLAGYRFARLSKDAAGKALGARRHAMVAVPDKPGKTGVLTFVALDDLGAKKPGGEVWAKDTKGKVPAKLPASLFATGWKRAEGFDIKITGQPREANAIGSCRVFAQANTMFYRNDWRGSGTVGVLEYAFPFTLLGTQPDGRGQPIQLIDKAFSRATSPKSNKHGYFFVDMLTIGGVRIDWVNDHGLCAIPAKYGGKTKRTFIVNTTGTVFGKDTGGKPVFDYPNNPAAAGWVIAE